MIPCTVSHYVIHNQILGSLLALLLGLKRLLVEFKFLALEDISIAASGLSRAGGYSGEQSGVSDKLLLELGVQFSVLLSLLDHLSSVLLLGDFGVDSAALLELDIVSGLVPFLELCCVDFDNASLHQGLCSHQLVVGGIVDNVQDTNLAGHAFAAPGKVALVQSEGAQLLISTSSADGVDTRSFCQLGVGGGATELELALLLVDGALATSQSTLEAA